jgi:hypothetical protein
MQIPANHGFLLQPVPVDAVHRNEAHQPIAADDPPLQVGERPAQALVTLAFRHSRPRIEEDTKIAAHGRKAVVN